MEQIERPPAIPSSLVQEFVIKAHRDLQRIQELLEQEPMLLNAAWDWGGGDWETALGGAAHMGRKDIALYLLAQGARIDIFAAAMLGNLAIVQAMLQIYSDMHQYAGPHGISLLRHARAGGSNAAAVVKLLESFETH